MGDERWEISNGQLSSTADGVWMSSTVLAALENTPAIRELQCQGRAGQGRAGQGRAGQDRESWPLEMNRGWNGMEFLTDVVHAFRLTVSGTASEWYLAD